jgi:hypothetical protein
LTHAPFKLAGLNCLLLRRNMNAVSRDPGRTRLNP